MARMNRRWGPGRIALTGVAVLLGWAAIVIVLNLIEIGLDRSDPLVGSWFYDGLGGAVWVIGALLVIGGGLAKVIEIGVRSGRQD